MRTVAYLIDGKTRYEVALDDAHKIHHRKQGTRKWYAVHMGINPDVETYLMRCRENFGWTIERA